MIDQERVTNELSLLTIGDFESLKFTVDVGRFRSEIKNLEDEWVDYLPREDRTNNRKGLILTNLPGKSHRENPSLREASIDAGRRLSELDFNEHTYAYEALPSLHPLLEQFPTLGRTFLVRCGIGGYFPPHRDHPSIYRESFRICVFLEGCKAMEYDWIIGSSQKAEIEEGRAYYVNTRKTHRTISWHDRSTHLIINVPVTTENVAKVIENLRHSHG